MISIFAHNDRDYTGNGRVILSPTVADVSAVAGGKYELDLEVPKDREGKWRLAATPELIVKVPIPGGVTEVAVQGDNAQVWRVETDVSQTALRAQPKEESIITYPAWVSLSAYTPGARVTYYGGNYQLLTALNTAEMSVPPVNLSTKWKSIDRIRPGAPVIKYMRGGTEFYLIDVYSSHFLHVQTYDGLEGYIAATYCEYLRTIPAEDIKPRVIETQLFRIKKVDETALTMVKASCQHVSYDHTGVVAGPCVINNAAPASAIAQMKNAMLWQPECTIATNLKAADGSFSATLTKKNLVNCLLDPQKGIVAHYNARLIRDNWDFFIYRRTERKSPITIRYGGNLAGLTVKRDSSKLVTRVRPIAKQSDGKTELYLAGDTPWVDSEKINDYDAIYMMDLDVDGKVGGDDGQDGTWTTATLRAHMEQKAREKFTIDHVDEPVITMTVDWLQLEKTSEFQHLAALGTLHMYDTVRVICEPDGIDAELFLSEFRWDAVRERYKTTTFTNVVSRVPHSVAGFMLTPASISFSNLAQEVRDKLNG